MNGNKYDTTDVSKANPKKVLKRKNAVKLFRRTFLYALTIIGISLCLSVFAIRVANDALAFMKQDSPVIVQIKYGSSLSQISGELKEAGIIKYKWAFELFATITNNRSKMKSGTRTLNTRMDYLELITKLKSNPTVRETVRVTIPEGKTQKEIVDLLVANGVCKREELEDALQNHQFDYWFLKDLPKRESRLEGYLFPDTYEFFIEDNPVNVVAKFLNNFEAKFTEGYRGRVTELGTTVDNLINLASLVEREAGNDPDRTSIASVFWNRLNSADLPYLQSDATVQYALGKYKEKLTTKDTQIDSPYNTYKYPGLPKGPICNPGEASIRAALWSDITNYYYFVADSAGKSTFSATLDEHNIAVANARKSSSATVQGTGTVED